MFKRRFLLIVFVSGLLTAFSAQAIWPFIIGGFVREAILLTAEDAAVGVIARGLSSSSPFVRTTATISRSRLATNIATSLRGSRWSGLVALLAAFAGLGWNYDEDIGLYTIIKTLPPGYCPASPSVNSADRCVLANFGQFFDNGAWTTPHQVDCGNMPNACKNGGIVKQTEYCISGIQMCSSGAAIFRFSGTSEDIKVPVPAADIDTKGLPQLAASPNTLGDMFAGANQDMLTKLLDGSTIPYNPADPTPQMAQLKSDYRNGLLQSIDPNAAHYVSPELMKQVQDLVNADDSANTDSGKLDALNAQMKQPITQAQYEESNLKAEAAQAGSLQTSLSTAFAPIAQLKDDHGFVLDKITNPSAPPSGVGFFKWTLPTGSCTGFNVDMSVGNGKLHTTKMVNEFCPFYETVAHPLLFWFLNIATFLYLFWLWDKSVSDMAR